MLGVRRFNGTQIDLWQGDFSTFVSDLSELPPSKTENWNQILQNAQARGGRHLSLSIDDMHHVDPVFTAIKSFLAGHNVQTTPKPILRITLVANSMDLYDALQERLFASFEDLDHE